jgi:hypothetical protein
VVCSVESRRRAVLADNNVAVEEIAMRRVRLVSVAVSLAVLLVGCASAASVARPGFYTEVRDGRLWVFREGSKELEEFKKQGEPAHQITRIGVGPKGMTVKSSDAKVIDEYLAAK